MHLTWHELVSWNTQQPWQLPNTSVWKKTTFPGRPRLLGEPIALIPNKFTLKIHIEFPRFEYLENMMKRSSGWGRLQAYMLNELQPLYDRLGFEASGVEP